MTEQLEAKIREVIGEHVILTEKNYPIQSILLDVDRHDFMIGAPIGVFDNKGKKIGYVPNYGIDLRKIGPKLGVEYRI